MTAYVAVLSLLSTIVLLLSAVARPDHARCPDGMWLAHGVRSTGDYSCTYKPIGGDHWDGMAWVDDSTVAPGEIRSKVYCTGGSIPVVYDGEAIGCQMRH